MPALLTRLSAAALLGACAAPIDDGLPPGASAPAPGKADELGGQVVYSSAETTWALLHHEDGAQRHPADLELIFAEDIEPAASAGAPWRYLATMSALGYYGPLGPYGPLGVLGPIGDQPWNPELYVTGELSWSNWSELFTGSGGPLSADGPLGSAGPLAEGAHERLEAAAGALGGFVAHLRPGGVFAPLGPIGVSGALGPLGPLGPAGAHGYRRGDGGHYLPDDGQLCHDAPAPLQEPPCRAIEVEWTPGGERRLYELVERYDEQVAAAMDDNDTSFVVTGAISREGADPDRFAFRSRVDQWVTVLVVPEYAKFPFVQAMSILGQSAALGYQVPASVAVPHLLSGAPIPYRYQHRESFDDFDLELSIDTGEVAGRIASASGQVVDWIHVRVPAGTRLEAAVHLDAQWRASFFFDGPWGLLTRPSTPHYRLVVVGSTAAGQGTVDFSGPYLRALE